MNAGSRSFPAAERKEPVPKQVGDVVAVVLGGPFAAEQERAPVRRDDKLLFGLDTDLLGRTREPFELVPVTSPVDEPDLGVLAATCAHEELPCVQPGDAHRLTEGRRTAPG